MRIGNLFLDRDGTVIWDRHYLRDPDGVDLLPGVGEALSRLARQGVRFFLVSNQSGIGRGIVGLEDYHACQRRLETHLAGYGVRLHDTAFCPHRPEEGCVCRKPSVGMWEALRARHGLSPDECAMVGDKVSDVGFGLRAGFAASVLVRTGHGEAHAVRLKLPPLDEPVQELGARRSGWPHAQAEDLAAAVEWLFPEKGAGARG